MFAKLSFLIQAPDHETALATNHPQFRSKFPLLISIIDCFEIFIDQPKNLHARACTYPNYRKHNTVKFLIGCTPGMQKFGEEEFQTMTSLGSLASLIRTARESNLGWPWVYIARRICSQIWCTTHRTKFWQRDYWISKEQVCHFTRNTPHQSCENMWWSWRIEILQ